MNMAQAEDRPIVSGSYKLRRFQECPFAKEECQKCGGTGHIARACKGQVSQKQEAGGSHLLDHIMPTIDKPTGYGQGLGTYFDDEAMSEKEQILDADVEETEKSRPLNTPIALTTTSSGEPVDPDPHRIRLLSWNTDGIDKNNVLTRAKAVAKIILLENPDVVFLQEVIRETAEIYAEHCPQYQLVTAGKNAYFVAMMLRTSSVVLKDMSITRFHSTQMGRNLLTVKATVKGVEMELLTSHLESMTAHSEERKRQLEKAFEEMMNASPQSTVIFGGDLNLRDKELAALGGIPEGLYDLWEVTGRRDNARYTWDTQKNDNLEMDWQFKPRLRFDRLYLRHPTSGPNNLKPVHFELVGIQRLTSCKRFPSDHWGILSQYDKVNS